jgi:predicted phosphohydrolase
LAERLRIAITADLHWGPHPRGDAATRDLAAFLRADPPHVFVIAGDVGAGNEFGPCLALFSDLPSRKAVLPGNHDIWVTATDPRGDSLDVYERHLREVAASAGFQYLDSGPLFLDEAHLAVAGTINWYDYSWSVEILKERFSDYELRLQTKQFSRGRHNDARFVRWPIDDRRFTARVVAKLEDHIQQTAGRADRLIVATHHPPFYNLGFPRIGPLSNDALLWDAFSGNRAIEDLLKRHADRVDFAFCGHTHLARNETFHGIRGYNVGGDYHFKRLLMLHWPEGTVEAHVFGNPDRNAVME